jgi:hypothetical protein
LLPLFEDCFDTELKWSTIWAFALSKFIIYLVFLLVPEITEVRVSKSIFSCYLNIMASCREAYRTLIAPERSSPDAIAALRGLEARGLLISWLAP